MYVLVEENPNCAPDERVFAESSGERPVRQVLLEKGWCDVTAVDEGGAFGEAVAREVQDSAAGVTWLVTGGAWGLRLRPAGGKEWSLSDADQWGVPFLVLDHSAEGIRFGGRS